MKGRMILAIIIAILALGLAIWCFIDGTYYIGVFALFICIAQVCNYFLIKKKRYWYDPKHITIALVLNIITSALYITLSAMCISDKSWGYAIIALCLFLYHIGIVRAIRKKAKEVWHQFLTPVRSFKSKILC